MQIRHCSPLDKSSKPKQTDDRGVWSWTGLCAPALEAAQLCAELGSHSVGEGGRGVEANRAPQGPRLRLRLVVRLDCLVQRPRLVLELEQQLLLVHLQVLRNGKVSDSIVLICRIHLIQSDPFYTAVQYLHKSLTLLALLRPNYQYKETCASLARLLGGKREVRKTRGAQAAGQATMPEWSFFFQTEQMNAFQRLN